MDGGQLKFEENSQYDEELEEMIEAQDTLDKQHKWREDYAKNAWE